MKVISLLKPEIKKWFEKSLESELYASNLYRHVANQMQRLGYFGAQKYFEKESAEELTHYDKLRDYINDMGDVAPVPAVPKMSDKVETLMDALELAYEFELDLMRQYQKFYEEAEDKYGDCVTASFLIEFMQIQRVSVGEYGDFISRLEKNEKDVFEFDEYLSEQ